MTTIMQKRTLSKSSMDIERLLKSLNRSMNKSKEFKKNQKLPPFKRAMHTFSVETLASMTIYTDTRTLAEYYDMCRRNFLWHRKILQVFEINGVDMEHIDNVAAEIDGEYDLLKSQSEKPLVKKTSVETLKE